MLLWMISLTLTTSLVLSGCKASDLDEIPVTELRVPLIRESIEIDGVVYYSGKCDIREVTNKQTLSSKRIRVGDLSECHGIWGLTPNDFAVLRAWLKDLFSSAKAMLDVRI